MVPILRFIAALAAGVLLHVPLAGQSPYRILVTNDDGVRAPGILAVAQALKAVGEVTIVAPADNQSGKGHSISSLDPVYIQTVTLAGGLEATALTATPASCINIAMTTLMKERPNLVVSGINSGVNSGRLSYVSGTVGGAREGALYGIPSIAASMSVAGGWNDYTEAAKATARVAEMVKKQGLPPGVFLNVNIPAGTPKGLRVAAQSSLAGTQTWTEQTNPRGRRYFWNFFREPDKDTDATSDVSAVAQGWVAVTPLKATEYDAATANRLKATMK